MKKSTPLLSKIMIPMIILALLQIFIFIAVLAFNGGFSYIKRYSFNLVSEKTESRKNYIETMFNQKTALVYGTANEINGITEKIFQEQDVQASAVREDKELNKLILYSCAEPLISLIRQDRVNDAFIILDTGALYDENGRLLRTGLYMRDTDVTENSISDNKDIFMEMGSSQVARDHGISLDFGWSLYLDVTDEEQCSFYHQPISTYAGNARTPLYNLGYWSGLSRISESQQESIKYTLPLAARDGTVYGVLGIGIIEKTVQQIIPANDFFNESACYILAADTDGSGWYEPMLHTGPAYERLVKDAAVLGSFKSAKYNLYDFTAEGGPKAVGSIHQMNLYNSGSPYRNQSWALISVADQDKTLSIYSALIKTIIISSLITLLISVAAALVSSKLISMPVGRLVGELGAVRKNKQLIEFKSTGISEIDMLSAAIIDLQKQIAQMKDDEYTAKLLQANAALRDAYDAASRANHAKTDFLSRMSHDIRTPMNGIIGMTTIAKNNLDNREKLADCLEKITSSSQYLLALINEVLDMSKIEAGKFVLAQESINIRKLAGGLVEMVKPMVKAKKHTFDVQIEDMEHENVLCDSLRIQQIFMNIMSNAIKYTAEGGHLFFGISEKPTQQLKVGCYEMIFIDDGNGMSPGFLQKLFDPFERAEDERVNKEQGTGLGMAITGNIVNMMDGDIQVESELDKGTKFTVTIFLNLDCQNMGETEKQTEDSTEEPAKGKDFSGHRVLLVDDNELNREIAVEIMGMTGLNVETAENGREAVDKFASSPQGYYDVIFMDIQMPVLNGYDASREIRALTHPDAQDIPIMAMTANAFAEDVRDARNAGMNEHIAKPLDVDKLFALLDKWLC